MIDMLTTKNYFNQLDVTTQGNSMTKVGKYDYQPKLKYADIKRETLPIPEILTPISENDESIHYHLTAEEGTTEYFPGVESPSKGYNGNLLGPVMKLRK